MSAPPTALPEPRPFSDGPVRRPRLSGGGPGDRLVRSLSLSDAELTFVASTVARQPGVNVSSLICYRLPCMLGWGSDEWLSRLDKPESLDDGRVRQSLPFKALEVFHLELVLCYLFLRLQLFIHATIQPSTICPSV